jgi:hypothetical protein
VSVLPRARPPETASITPSTINSDRTLRSESVVPVSETPVTSWTAYVPAMEGPVFVKHKRTEAEEP